MDKNEQVKIWIEKLSEAWLVSDRLENVDVGSLGVSVDFLSTVL